MVCVLLNNSVYIPWLVSDDLSEYCYYFCEQKFGIVFGFCLDLFDYMQLNRNTEKLDISIWIHK